VVFAILSVKTIIYKIAEKKNNLFITKYQEHDYSGALTSINSALKFDPKNAQLLANKGFLLYEMHQTDSVAKMDHLISALTCYKKAVEYSPQDPYLHQNLAGLFSILDKPDSAGIHYQKACALSDNTALFHASRGIFFEKNGKTNDAWSEYQKTIRFSPDILDSKLGRKLSADHKDAFNQMLYNIADSLFLKIKCNDSPIIKSRLAKILLCQGDTVKASFLLEQVSAQLPNLDRVWYQWGILKRAQNDTTLFLKYLNRAILLDSRDYLYSLVLGDYYYQQSRSNDAIYYYKQALVNYANIYTLRAIIAPKWYGYKALSNDILPQNRLDYIKPSLNKRCLCDKLIGLYNGFGQVEEVILFERYKNDEISIKKLLKELNKSGADTGHHFN
jgi:tetratricopeptide (TPR) repeat protein